MATVSGTHFTTPVVAAAAVPVPRLEPGDRLSREEFWRRYEAMPEVKKAELIEGVVYMGSPVRFSQHGQPHADFAGWLALYRFNTPGVVQGDNSTLKLDNENVPQPDAVLMIEAARGGQAKIDANGYIEGAPELVAEIASSSVSIDMHAKFRMYQRSGAREYIVWRVLDGAIDWFVLRGGEYRPLAPGDDGILRSETFPGLWLDAPALLGGKFDAVTAALQQGIASSEHREFVARLEVAPKA